MTSFINSEEVFGKQVETESTPKATEPAEFFEKAVSINQFVEDIKLRYPEEFNKAYQLKVYFFSDKSVYYNEIKNTYGMRTTTRHYAYIRPEMLVFASLSPDKKVINKVLNGGLDVYCDYGIRFETHIKRQHNSEESLRIDREIMNDSKVNVLLINTKQQTYLKKPGRFDAPIDQEIKYYDWTTKLITESRPDYKYMMNTFYDKAEQFQSLEEMIEKNDDGTLTF